jgi:hypothetical protein
MCHFYEEKVTSKLLIPPSRIPSLEFIGLRVKERTSPVQTFNDLKQTLHQEW